MASYTRSFIALQQEHQEYTIKGKAAAGKCIIESRGGQGKISLSVSNLKPEVKYQAYLISAGNGESIGVPIGSLYVDDKGKGDLKWSCDAANAAGTGKELDKFNIAAVLFITGDGIIAPLVGYKEEEVSWKRGFTVYGGAADKKAEPAEPPVMKAKQETAPINEVEENKKIVAPAAPVEQKKEEIIPPETKHILPESGKAENTYQSGKDTLHNIKLYGNLPEAGAGDCGCGEVKEETNVPEPDAITDENAKYTDFFEDPAADPIHETFKSMAKKFNDEMAELENYTFADKDKKAQVEEKNVILQNYKIDNNVDYIFDNYVKMDPFKNQTRNVIWIRISLKELIYFPYRQWELMNEPFIISSYKQYNHLMMGLQKSDAGNELFLAVPDTYSKKKELQAKSLGFKQFRCCESKQKEEGTHGYWVVNTLADNGGQQPVI